MNPLTKLSLNGFLTGTIVSVFFILTNLLLYWILPQDFVENGDWDMVEVEYILLSGLVDEGDFLSGRVESWDIFLYYILAGGFFYSLSFLLTGGVFKAISCLKNTRGSANIAAWAIPSLLKFPCFGFVVGILITLQISAITIIYAMIVEPVDLGEIWGGIVLFLCPFAIFLFESGRHGGPDASLLAFIILFNGLRYTLIFFCLGLAWKLFRLRTLWPQRLLPE